MTEQSSRLPTADSVVASQPADFAIPPMDTAPITAPETDVALAPSLAQEPADGATANADSRAPADDAAPDESANDAPDDVAGAAKKRIPPQAVVAQLIAAWPQAFFNDPRAVKPLAIGTLQQILANRPAALEGFNSHAIRTGIKFYTSRLSYHYGMVNNTHRITLAGEAADEVDDKAREFAKTQIIAIQQQRAARRAAQNPPVDSADVAAESGDSDSGERPSRRPPRRRRVAQPSDTGAGSAAGAAAPAGDHAARPDRAESARAGQPRAAQRASHPRSDRRQSAKPTANHPATQPAKQSIAAEPARSEQLTLEEKLARLAQHFGKPS